MVAKKLHYREASLQVRDVFDLAVVQSHSPQALWDARDSWSADLPAIRRRTAGPSHAIPRPSTGVASLARGGTQSAERLSAGSGVYRSSVPNSTETNTTAKCRQAAKGKGEPPWSFLQ